METVAGIFSSRASAERAVEQLEAAGIATDRITFLTPGKRESEIEASVPISDSEQPGMGKALGGTVGVAIGGAAGAGLGAGVASLLVPGVGPVLAAGIIGAAILGVGGATTGMAAGAALENELADGLPHDELFLYEDALRKGRTVVIVFADEEKAEEQARKILAEAGAESSDAARENWWLGFRETGFSDAQVEDMGSAADYRRGFEAALHTKLRGRTYEEAAPELIVFYHEARSNAEFRRGYDSGYAYYKSLQEQHKT